MVETLLENLFDMGQIRFIWKTINRGQDQLFNKHIYQHVFFFNQELHPYVYGYYAM